jgi:hypothetical protein
MGGILTCGQPPDGIAGVVRALRVLQNCHSENNTRKSPH